MILPLASGAAGDPGRRRLVGALLGVLWLVGCITAAQAQSDDPYTATVKVDATSDTVVKAREQARLDGQRRALTGIVDRLAGGADKAKMPKLDDNAITDMVVSFEVAHERMSPVRYMADYTYHFRPANVQRVLRLAGVASPSAAANPDASSAPANPTPPANAGKPALLLPVYQIGTRLVLWEDPNPWREAWLRRQEGQGAGTNLTLPLGDVEDVAMIDAERARAGDSDGLDAVAQKYGVDEVIVALAAVRGPPGRPAGLDVTVKRYREGEIVDVHNQSLDAKPDETTDAFFARAVKSTAAAIGSNWKGIASQPDQQGKLVAVVQIDGLDDWLRLRERIAQLPAIRSIDVRSLSTQEATIEIGYVGDVDQLTTGLTGIGLDLVRGDPVWRLSRAAAAEPR
jgi:hypothetical protein